MDFFSPLDELDPSRFETLAIMKNVVSASRALSEFKGAVASLPHSEVLIHTMGLQEAKDSSAIENIVTTHDELFMEGASARQQGPMSPAAKEVFRYRAATQVGFAVLRERELITLSDILAIQEELLGNNAGFRKLPGTALKDDFGRTIYTPPQNHAEILDLMKDVERFINVDRPLDPDPLVKMALLHHRFESIHPFYDGNGRTGRILNELYLVKRGLLNVPVLYLSRYILRTKTTYYRLLQAVREHDAWEEWVLYMLNGVEEISAESIPAVEAIKEAQLQAKHAIRARHKFYSQTLINHLFSNPYTKIEFLQRDLKVTRLTATKYLEALTADGHLHKQKMGRSNYYINVKLYDILAGEWMPGARN